MKRKSRFFLCLGFLAIVFVRCIPAVHRMAHGAFPSTENAQAVFLPTTIAMSSSSKPKPEFPFPFIRGRRETMRKNGCCTGRWKRSAPRPMSFFRS